MNYKCTNIISIDFIFSKLQTRLEYENIIAYPIKFVY